MLSNTFTRFWSWGCPTSANKCPSQQSKSASHDFHILASLQVAMQNPTFARNTSEKPSAAEMLGGGNDMNLRMQGKLCLTFALRKLDAANHERIRIANELEESINAAFTGEDYRRRIYIVGGELAEAPALYWKLQKQQIDVEKVAIFDTSVPAISAY